MKFHGTIFQPKWGHDRDRANKHGVVLGYGVMATSCFYPNGTFYGSPAGHIFLGYSSGVFHIQTMGWNGVFKSWSQKRACLYSRNMAQ